MIVELIKNNEGLIEQNKKLLEENISLMKESEILMRESYMFKEQSTIIDQIIQNGNDPEKLAELLVKIMESNKCLMENNLLCLKEIKITSSQIELNNQQSKELAGHCDELVSESESNMQQNMKLMILAKQMITNNAKLMIELDRVKAIKLKQMCTSAPTI